MSAGNLSRIETLNKENYDTWKMQMEALLVKNDAWIYVNGECKQPTVIAGNAESENAQKLWFKNDNKAKSDIILSISPSELKQIKGCATSRDVWIKLEGIYQSKGPARKATLLKQLTLQRMEDGGNVREHIEKFFDAVDKLQEMDVQINPDLLAVMLLYSLPTSYENFRCAIESRDELPSPDTLRVKIIEESDARKDNSRSAGQNAMFTNKQSYKRWPSKKDKNEKPGNSGADEFKYRCHRCKVIGHKAADCRSNAQRTRPSAKIAEGVGFIVSEALHSSHFGTKWCLDSGATSHLCRNLSDFSEIKESNRGNLNLANSASTKISAEGTASFAADVDGEEKNITLNGSLHVPDLRINLLSVGKITNHGFEVIFQKDKAVVVGNNGDVKMIADRVGDLYYAREWERNSCNTVTNDARNSDTASEMLHVWHRRLGHLNVKDLRDALRRGVIKGATIEQFEGELSCDICLRGKMTRTPFPKKSTRKTTQLEIIHSDVCGPMRVQSNGKSRYYVTFIDDQSRWCEIRFLNSKNEVFNVFKEYKKLVENQKQKKVKCLQSDNGTEYKNKNFDEFLKEQGVTRRLTIPYNPEQNGIAERKNRSLLDTARCLLMGSNLPPSFWAEAINTANYIRNRCPTKSLDGKTPYEVWHGKKPDVSHFKEFGCPVFCLNREPGKGKFEPRCREGIFLGYAEESKGYRVWLPNERRIEITRDVKFVEKNTSQIGNFEEFGPEAGDDEEAESKIPERREVDIEMNPLPEVIIETAAEEPEPAESGIPQEESSVHKRGPGRPRMVKSGSRGRPKKRSNERKEARKKEAAPEEAHLAEIPLKQALNSSDKEEWYRAMATEVTSIIKNDTWKIVKRPNSQVVIGSRIVLRNKYKTDGTLEKRKARVVAQGFAQRPGIHFNETFAPVARLSSIRLLAALAARFGMSIHQFDVTTAYLNSKIDEEVFMELPKHLSEVLETIATSTGSNSDIGKKAKKMLAEMKAGDKVCILKKSLYGLRQAGRNWHARLDKFLKNMGSVPSNADPCLYHLKIGDDLVLMTVYVDDILVASRNPEACKKLNSSLSSEFEIKYLGEVNCCLGIEFTRDGNKIALRQKGYINDLLQRFGMTESNPVRTPMDPNVKLTKNESSRREEYENLPYRELIGALMYLAIATRPDISFAVSCLSQFNNCYEKTHWIAAKRVLRYLKGTSNFGIIYEPSADPVKGYVDADWGNCLNDRKSYTGFTFILSNGPITWESRKQRTVALSSTEAEYMSLSDAAKEAIYLRSLLIELGLKEIADIVIYNDNNGAKMLAENPTFHARSKHIDMRFHFIRDVLKEKKLRSDHVTTEDMIADLLTKGLPGPKHKKCMEMLGLKEVLDHADRNMS